MTIDRQTWLLLILLSVLWGGAFFFIGVAVRELPPFTVVLARVAFGAFLLVPLLKLLGGTSLPACRRSHRRPASSFARAW